jgi:hypothetical protein
MISALFWDITLRNIPEERRYHQHRGGSLKSRLLGDVLPFLKFTWKQHKPFTTALFTLTQQLSTITHKHVLLVMLATRLDTIKVTILV